ncbi:MAG: hypothetical protein AB7Q29_08320 [Vicinamibacterales bacterium]
MKTTRILAALVFLFAAATAAKASEVTLTGTIGDAMCGATHMMANNESMCTGECVKKGSDYALIVGDKVYTLKAGDAQKTELAKLAGKSATIKGDANGTTVQVASVSAAK